MYFATQMSDYFVIYISLEFDLFRILMIFVSCVFGFVRL